MRRFLVIVVMAVALGCAPAVPPWTDADRALVASGPADNPFVHTDGTRLVDGNGERVRLRGFNLGGWLSWEGWMFGGGWSMDGETKMMTRLADVIGDDDADAFREAVRERFITGDDIAAIAETGANAVRVGVNHVLLEDDDFEPREQGYAILDRLLDACDAHGVRVILDLHSAPGGQSTYWMADPDDVTLWESESKQDRTVKLWKTIARRYADRDAIAAYDLLNEPSAPDGATLLAFYQRLADAVRDVDPNHLIILEGSGAATELALFTSAVTWNQAYSVHQYEFFGDWRTDELTRWTAVSEAHNVPLWVGEFGLDEPEQLHTDVELYNDTDGVVGFALWSWKEAVPSENDMPMIVTDAPDEWKKVAEWMNGGWGKPTKDEAERGIAGFLEAIAVSACAQLDDVVDAFD